MFWDTSALVPLCVAQDATVEMKELMRGDSLVTVWWGTVVEGRSALARLRREGFLDEQGEEIARGFLQKLRVGWSEIEPGEKVRQQALRFISVHGLKAADALQLAAAFIWAGGDPDGYSFVCLDGRLREAGKKEGFILRPETV
ncbi:MAG: type II toxin-antitoxin system VapC family toxin [Gemmatimonadetes bacterium]|jgi:uncharacterized protein|nr:type II toxin-antitoxin system VapC family toxin [Gemmatimonadota bacterium]